jgi:hypothetical protein
MVLTMFSIDSKFPATVVDALPQNESRLDRRIAFNRFRSV